MNGAEVELMEELSIRWDYRASALALRSPLAFSAFSSAEYPTVRNRVANAESD
jgi:hypothetical protein